MSTIPQPAVYADLLDLLASTVDPDRVLAFPLSGRNQASLDDLLEKNREGRLTGQDRPSWTILNGSSTSCGC